MVYCSRAQFSIDLLYIAIWESWIKMAWLTVRWRYIYAFKSHTSAEILHVYSFLYLKWQWQDRNDNGLISMICITKPVFIICRSIIFKMQITGEFVCNLNKFSMIIFSDEFKLRQMLSHLESNSLPMSLKIKTKVSPSSKEAFKVWRKSLKFREMHFLRFRFLAES